MVMPNQDWYSALQDSAVYMPLITRNFLADATCFAQWEFAREQKKLFLILLEQNVTIPEEMLEGIDVVLIEKWSEFDKQSFKQTSKKLLNRFDFLTLSVKG